MSSSQSSINHPIFIQQNSVYKTLLDSLPAAVYLCDSNGYVTYYNPAAVSLWGRAPEIGKDLWCGSWKIYHPDGSPMPVEQCPMAETLTKKRPIIGQEIIIEQPNGRRFNILPHPHPIYNDRGVMVGAVNMLVDITHQSHFKSLQRQTEELTLALELLQRSEERYHKMVSEVQDYAIILLSRDGTIENWNKGAEKIKGYTEQDVLGKHFRIFYPVEDQQRFLPERLIQEALEKGKSNHEGWRVRKDGSLFWASISITALHNPSGTVIGFSKVTRDLTERRKQELQIRQMNEDLQAKNQMLRISEERYHRMVAEVEDYVIILLDLEGLIQNWNKGAEKIKGYTSEEIIGKHFRLFYSEADQKKGLPEHLLAQATKVGKAIHEGWRLRKNGSSFWGSVVMTALHNDEGDVIGFTKVTRDLTAKKKAEEKLMRASVKLQQKNKELERTNEELSSFAYISSHDLQEPLRKIQTFSDRILELEAKNLSEKGKDYLTRMQSGAMRMQTLIRDILTYSKTTTSEKKFEPTDLNAVLANARLELEEAISEKKGVIESDKLPTLNLITYQVQQLFNNLLNNALKFSKPEVAPHIVIRSSIVDSRSVPNVGPIAAKECCHISFQDNGIGFEPEYEKKIFEVFQRLHDRNEYGGTGIGLAICKKIAENHHGVIVAEGNPGQGATFHVYLPLHQ